MLQNEVKKLISKGEIAGKDLHGSYCVGFDFSNLDLANTDFRGCVLTNAKFENCTFNNTNMDGAILIGTGLTGKTEGIITSEKTLFTNDAPTAVIKGADTTKPIIVGDISTVSNDVWATEWRPHSPNGTEPICFGGSDMGTLASKSTFKGASRRGLLLKKMGASPVVSEDNAILRAGHRWEKGVADAFVDYMLNEGGCKSVKLIETTDMYQHPLHRWLLADMDFLAEVDGELCILECKTTSNDEKIAKWKKGIVPEEYTYQLLLYMAIGKLLGIKTAYITCEWGVVADAKSMAVCKRSLTDKFEYDGTHTLEEIQSQMLTYVDKIYNKLIMGEEIKDTSELDEKAFGEILRAYASDSYPSDLLKSTDVYTQFPLECEDIFTRVMRIDEQIEGFKNREEELTSKRNALLADIIPLFGDTINGWLKKESGDIFFIKRIIYNDKGWAMPSTETLEELDKGETEKFFENTIPTVAIKEKIAEVREGRLSLDDLETILTSEDTRKFNEKKFRTAHLKGGVWQNSFAPLGKCEKPLLKEESRKIEVTFSTKEELEEKNEKKKATKKAKK